MNVSSPLLSFVRLSAFLAFTLALLPFQLLAVALGFTHLAKQIPLFYHSNVLRVFGFAVSLRGRISEARPTLFVSNHVSYLDIEVLGALLPASFVAKSEVKSWPLFGWLAQAQRSVFVDRKVGSMRVQVDQLSNRLREGDSLVLFPEGTTGDGNHVRRFRSALFAVAEETPDDKPLVVQPVSIAYVGLNGVPIGRDLRSFFAWYGDMEMPLHLWRVLGLGRVEIVVEFHRPVTLVELGSRKALSDHCERVVAEAVAAANAGRLRPLPETDTVKVPDLAAETAPGMA